MANATINGRTRGFAYGFKLNYDRAIADWNQAIHPPLS
jgi:hypothetical protein